MFEEENLYAIQDAYFNQIDDLVANIPVALIGPRRSLLEENFIVYHNN